MGAVLLAADLGRTAKAGQAAYADVEAEAEAPDEVDEFINSEIPSPKVTSSRHATARQRATCTITRVKAPHNKRRTTAPLPASAPMRPL